MFRYAIAKWQYIINPDAGARDQEQQESTGMIRREITIINKLGLHARLPPNWFPPLPPIPAR